MAELVVDHLSKEFSTRGEPLVVLRDVSLALSGGQNAAILGPSGSGKSTLLFIIGTLDSPSGGNVRLSGVDPFGLMESQLAEFRNRNVGFVFQDHYLLPQLTVLENVLVPAMADGTPASDCVERAKYLLGRVGLAERLEHRPAELSGGERQRVAVARALIHHPVLLLADEPTGALDSRTSIEIMAIFQRLNREQGITIVLVTHDAEVAEYSQRNIHFKDGNLQLDYRLPSPRVAEEELAKLPVGQTEELAAI
jgi:lipoprotein-releasing system ATP-binding protein